MAGKSPFLYVRMDSPVGPLCVVQGGENIVGVFFGESAMRNHFGTRNPVRGQSPLLRRAVMQLKEYFSGGRKKFALPLALDGTAFQKKVWKALAQVPPGRTLSYRDLAGKCGNARAARAVGGAVGANPACVVVPCHRVIAADGSLGGFSGGLARKRTLLAHEGGSCAKSRHEGKR